MGGRAYPPGRVVELEVEVELELDPELELLADVLVDVTVEMESDDTAVELRFPLIVIGTVVVVVIVVPSDTVVLTAAKEVVLVTVGNIVYVTTEPLTVLTVVGYALKGLFENPELGASSAIASTPKTAIDAKITNLLVPEPFLNLLPKANSFTLFNYCNRTLPRLV